MSTSFNTGAFARAKAMMAAIGALMAQGLSGVQLQQGIQSLGPYQSRGKGGKRPHIKGNGQARVKREALKARNRAKHRAACKGGR